RLNAGLITVIAGILYAPVRFFLDFLRPETSDPRYFGLTFAQYASILALGTAIYVAMRVLKTGKPAEMVGPTSGEVQRRLRMVLNESDAKATAVAAMAGPKPEPKPPDPKSSAIPEPVDAPYDDDEPDDAGDAVPE